MSIQFKNNLYVTNLFWQQDEYQWEDPQTFAVNMLVTLIESRFFNLNL